MITKLRKIPGNPLQILGLAWLAGSVSSYGAEAERKPNIVCIFSDEIDFSYLGCYGGDFKTPNIDSLARDGMRFTDAFCTAPMCTPSRYSTLTGLYPGRCYHPRFKDAFPPDEPSCIEWNSYIDENTKTLPRLLSASGYVTGISGKWHLGPHGVDWKAGLTTDSDPLNPDIETLLRARQKEINEAVKRDGGFDYAASVLWGNWDSEVLKALQHHNIPWITKGAVEFIEQQAHGEKPFFLYVTPTTIHGPPHHLSLDHDYTITPGGRDKEVLKYVPDIAALKAANQDRPEWARHQRTGMAELDYEVGIILAKLKELNIESNTVVIYMPDHGIEPGKAVCYGKGFRVPLIIRWPGKVAPGTRAGARVQNTDLFATIAQIAGVPDKQSATPDASSFYDVLMNPENPGRRDYVYYESGYARGISDRNYKYISWRVPERVITAMKEGKKGGAINYLNKPKQSHSQVAIMHFPDYFDQDQFFDLKKDPYEQRNLAGDPSPAEQAELTVLKTRLQSILSTMPNAYSLKKIPFMDSPEFRKLCEEQKAIGTDYIEWLKRDHGTIIWPPVNEDK